MKGKLQTLYLIVLWSLFDCSHDEKIIPNNRAPIAEIQILQEPGKLILNGSLSSDPDGNVLTYRWSSSSDKITITGATASKAVITLPIVSEPFNTDIFLEVSDGILKNQASKTILIPSSNLTQIYGLGNNLTKEISNNASYEWYFDQGNSGTYSAVNCGPTSVTMAIKWANESFTKTPQDARDTYRSSGGWWFTSDIINYLNNYSVTSYTVPLTDIGVLTDKIDKGDIIILCLDMYYVDDQSVNTYHVNKFYNTNTIGWGHFIVVKGYKVVDYQTFFEVYDPYCFGSKYQDNSLKGKDRYYKAINLDNATNNWWDFAIVIPKPGLNGGRMTADPNAVDPAFIQHKSGQ